MQATRRLLVVGCFAGDGDWPNSRTRRVNSVAGETQ